MASWVILSLDDDSFLNSSTSCKHTRGGGLGCLSGKVIDACARVGDLLNAAACRQGFAGATKCGPSAVKS